MLARFCSRSKPLEGFSARARLGSKIVFVIFARARLGLKIFSLGSLELEKFTLVPNTKTYIAKKCLDFKETNTFWQLQIFVRNGLFQYFFQDDRTHLAQV